MEDKTLDFRLEHCWVCYRQFPHKELILGRCVECTGQGAVSSNSIDLTSLYKAGKELGEQLKAEKEAVDHPKHYNMGSLEVIEVLKDWGMLNDFCLGNAIKYIARARHKGKFTEDLKKAIWYLQYAIGEGK